jgi:hypothetical protein
VAVNIGIYHKIRLGVTEISKANIGLNADSFTGFSVIDPDTMMD